MSTKRKLDKEQKEKSKKIKTEEAIKRIPSWEDYDLLSQKTSTEPAVAKSLIELFNEGNTIPFIARYRRNIVGELSPDELRLIKDKYEEICCLKSKLKNVIGVVEKSGHLDDKLAQSFASVRTLEELEHLYAPFKPENKGSLSERAKALGLNEPALEILNGNPVNIERYVNSKKDGLKKIEDVEKGIINIIASIIATDTEMLIFLRELRENHYFIIETKKCTSKQEKKETSEKRNTKDKRIDESKYELYFDFKISSNNIKPHQVLAINRGEHQKVLSVKIQIPDFFFKKFHNACLKFCKNKGLNNRLIEEAIKDCYSRIVQPLIKREIRANLKQTAENVSINIFTKNLKRLLLTTPVKGKIILGIDPGFSNGCKLALISETGNLIDCGVIFPFKKFKENEAKNNVKKMLNENNCDLIAIGNGTACRETETWLSELITSNFFKPLNINYTIVNEDGASIYSCSSEAKKEFPELDPNIVSAISLARRLQDPLAELVKIEPQHLGVGMYQHDLKKKDLNETLGEVVSDCVSFVGVDLNTTSQRLLKSVAGLSDKKSSLILQYRDENGFFSHRKELLKIKGIGNKVFVQCAGFLRVGPINLKEEKNFYKNPNTTKLDRTIIHPESYEVTRKLLKEMKLKENDIGGKDFIQKLNTFSSSLDLIMMSNSLKTDVEILKLILDALNKPLNHDLRSEYDIKPLFKQEITNIKDIKIGTVLSGRISNVTSFGCFVDIGVNTNGLIHISKLKRAGAEIQIGDKVEVKVLNVDVERKRIGLTLV